MGDISELRGIITIGSFLGILVLLIGWIPAPFYVEEYEGRTITAPEYFEAIELEQYATIWNFTLDESDQDPEYLLGWWVLQQEIGGHHIEFWYIPANSSNTEMFAVRHSEFWWIFKTGRHVMELWNGDETRGDNLGKSEIDADYENDDLSYTAKCDHAEVDVFFAFNETKYSTPTEALNHHGLHCMVGIEWDQVATSMSAWDIIGMLLFFQLPNVHWMVNALIAIPIWLGIAYLSFIMILRAIGAIFGGGA